MYMYVGYALLHVWLVQGAEYKGSTVYISPLARLFGLHVRTLKNQHLEVMSAILYEGSTCCCSIT